MVSDNTTAVTFINNVEGVKLEQCREVAYNIWRWWESRDIWLYTTDNPGQENEIADSVSRKFSSTVEWELSDGIW